MKNWKITRIRLLNWRLTHTVEMQDRPRRKRTTLDKKLLESIKGAIDPNSFSQCKILTFTSKEVIRV